ncbi:MAG: epoxyqueuosine reductase QueH [Clostridia bacterium]|nr:epoxyqueuosine reductase QueH [Clostridia bacterium]
MKKMLLHTCCAPCSTTTIERLSKDYDLTILYYNPNIYPEEEYLKRKNEQIRYLGILNSRGQNIKMIDCDYNQNEFFDAAKGLEDEPEGGKRCAVCFALRLDFVAKKAKELGYDIFATSLTISPHKNAKLINEIGMNISKKYGVEYLVSDFKEQDGYKRSIEICKENCIYRQRYCGCKYSIWFETEH